MDIATALGVLKTAWDLTVNVRDEAKTRKLKPEEVLERILEIQHLLADARSGLVEAQEEIARLKGTIRGLEGQLTNIQDLKDNFEFRDNMYWRKGAEEGPFCPTCVDADKRLVRLLDCCGHYECRVHGQNYLTAAQWEEAMRPPSVF